MEVVLRVMILICWQWYYNKLYFDCNKIRNYEYEKSRFIFMKKGRYDMFDLNNFNECVEDNQREVKSANGGLPNSIWELILLLLIAMVEW